MKESARATILGIGLGALGLVTLVALITPVVGPPLSTGDPMEGELDDWGEEGAVSPIVGYLPSGLAEVSGIAASRAHPDLFWAHEDGGFAPRLYAVRSSGRVETVIALDGPSLRDWEDLALGPCPEPGDGGDCLYVADIGDNGANRDFVRILVLREPSPGGEVRSIAPTLGLDIRYPDGSADAEALAVTANGDLLIATKGEGGPIRLYRVEASRFGEASDITAALEAVLSPEPEDPADRVTGAAVSPEGRLALRTLRSVLIFAPGDYGRPAHICRIDAEEPQGEAVDFLDERTLILTGESRGDRAPILELTCG